MDANEFNTTLLVALNPKKEKGCKESTVGVHDNVRQLAHMIMLDKIITITLRKSGENKEYKVD